MTDHLALDHDRDCARHPSSTKSWAPCSCAAIAATRERDQARAEAVAVTIRADDLRHRIEALHRPFTDASGLVYCGDPGDSCCGHRWPCPTTRAVHALYAEPTSTEHRAELVRRYALMTLDSISVERRAMAQDVLALLAGDPW